MFQIPGQLYPQCVASSHLLPPARQKLINEPQPSKSMSLLGDQVFRHMSSWGAVHTQASIFFSTLRKASIIWFCYLLRISLRHLRLNVISLRIFLFPLNFFPLALGKFQFYFDMFTQRFIAICLSQFSAFFNYCF